MKISGYLVLDVLTQVFINSSAGADYMSIMNAPVVFMSGDPLGTTACQNVTIFDDNVVEAEEMFTVSTSSSDPVIISPTSQAEINITDNDGESKQQKLRGGCPSLLGLMRHAYACFQNCTILR